MKKLLKIMISVVLMLVVLVFNVCAEYYPCGGGHYFETVEKGYMPTCTEVGYTDFVLCTTCGLVKHDKEELPATGHEFTAWVTEIKPTVTLQGLHSRTCKNCGEKETLITDTLNFFAGDLDNNNVITAYDARIALRVSAGLEFFKESYVEIADMNADGLLTAADARIILRKAANLE